MFIDFRANAPRQRYTPVLQNSSNCAFVGADLSAKTVVQPVHFWRMYLPFREQVRSHKVLTTVRCSA
ncbi:hypothetical protein D5S10_10570 [Pseudomonas savastanoi]|nr:hypothetical protein D5S10_10570 [Pseudomonas savastanoi]